MLTSTGIERRIRGLATALSRRQIMLVGWLGFMAYAYPGYMSYDSVFQLNESRTGYFSDGHPPAMAELWRIVELFVAGPLGMLVIQSVCFLAGAYLVFTRFMSDKAAAVTASLLLWFPPIAAVMAVIWKDSQMAGYLMLGLGLLLADRRRSRVLGLVALLGATLMRHNALVMTGPLIAICFVWNPAHRFWKRHAIAVAAFIVVTLSAQVITGALTKVRRYIWTDSLALCDITATLRYTTPTISDDELRETFKGIKVLPAKNLHEFARRNVDADYVQGLWKTAYDLFDIPDNQAERDAVVRAWKQIVLSHPKPYLTYRWEIFRRLIQWSDDPLTSPIYNWFVDVQSPYYSALRAYHDAYPARIQELLRRSIHVVGATPLFYVMIYATLAILMLPLSLRDRRVLALLASGITSEAVLFLIAPTTDWRYSFWLIAATIVALIMLIARRMTSVHGSPPIAG